MCTLLADERPTARRSHYCSACGGTITPGQRYVRQRIVDAGDHWVWKAHELCDAAALFLMREAGAFECESPDQYEVREVVGDVLRFLLLAPPRLVGRRT